MNKLIEKARSSIILIHIPVGFIFLSEGIQKFLYPEIRGVGRFIKIGIPYPEIMAPFVGITEIICGTLILIGLLTGTASVPLIVDMLVAIYTTKLPILIKDGFWEMAHEARTDFAMLFCLLFILICSLNNYTKQVKD